LKKSPSSFASYVSVSRTDFHSFSSVTPKSCFPNLLLTEEFAYIFPLFISQFLPELDSAAFAFP